MFVEIVCSRKPGEIFASSFLMAPCTETNGFPHSDFEVKNGLNFLDPATKNGVLEPESQDSASGIVAVGNEGNENFFFFYNHDAQT